MTDAQYRAALLNVYAAGADGFSVQNHFFHWGRFTVGSNRPGATPNQFHEDDNPDHPEAYPNPLKALRQLRDHTTLQSEPRHYTFLPLWEGRGMSLIYEKEEIVLTRGEIRQQGTFRFRICDQLPDRAAKHEECRLVIQAIGASESDELSIAINDTAVESSDQLWDYNSDPPTCTILVSDPPFQFGDNDLGITLAESAVHGADIVVERLDCYVS